MRELTPEVLDIPRTVKDLMDLSGWSESRVRTWLKRFGLKLSVGYTRPRTFWLPEQESAKRKAEFRDTMDAVAARNRM